jgi:glycerol-3-phosphate dehydrogenase (NAD(P)+)
MQVSVLGAGRWGSFLAWYLDKVGHRVRLWGREGSEKMRRLITCRRNDLVELGESIELTCDLEAAMEAEILVVSIGAQHLRDFARQLSAFPLQEKTVVLCMKGLEEHTGKRLSQIVAEEAPQARRLAIWVGPGHVQDFVRQVPNCMVIDSQNEAVKGILVRQFSSGLIRFYYGNDMIGNEIGAASKNVIGIAAGMLDGKGYGSLKGALMSRGTREIAKLIRAMGGNELSAYGLSHLGDYGATVFSQYSHNKRFGELFVQGRQYDKLAEGVATSCAMVTLAKKYDVELPICQAVYDITRHGKDPEKVFASLFVRSLKKEF